ncbi:hypothetical protein NE236_00120 [Actinoallomurus purpureus]|uniref:hypothetical protein n=1 Tax=Actinoallomurus purpureus TaxID=478114 RepID=UPI0020920025|nr:hypothetical protein [Actinoallomurus purpureus]MCO6003382.1 hypothetical protein [Actinoallomurus purpureus]
MAALNEQAAKKPAEVADKGTPKATSEQGSVVAEKEPGSSATSQAAETSGTAGKDRLSFGPYDDDRDQSDDASGGKLRSPESVSPAQEDPGEVANGRRDDPADAGGDGEAQEDHQQAASTPEAATEQPPLERTDKAHEVKPPQIVGDYYPSIPPTAQDRYLVRDKSNPVPIFDGPPTRDQVAQNDVGDCGIVATLGSVAEHRPEAIKNAIKQVGDGEYEITLHEVTEATPADPVARPTGDVKTYRVNDELPVRTDDPTRPLVGIGAESCGWAAIMEKAIAAEDQTWDTSKNANWDQEWTTWHKPAVDRDRASAGLGASPNDAPRGYNRLDIGSTAYQRADLLAKLTGEDAEVRRIPDEQQGEQALLDTFRDQLNAGKPVLVGTRGTRVAGEQFPNRLVAGHAYEVTKIENDELYLRNPWGRRHPDPMDAKTFWEYYRRYNYDGTRGGHFTTLK